MNFEDYFSLEFSLEFPKGHSHVFKRLDYTSCVAKLLDAFVRITIKDF
jgi:hypothetical protein